MGKTTTIIQAIKGLIENDDYADKGVLVFLSRLEEIENLVKAMGLEKEQFSCVVQNYEKAYGDRREFLEALAKMGNAVPEKARVVFATQQRLETYATPKEKGDRPTFAGMKDFHYKGKPRQVRIWDESILPSIGLTLTKRALQRLPYEIPKKAAALAREIERFAEDLLPEADGEQIQMPDIDMPELELDLDTFRSWFKSPSDKEIAETFWSLSGHTVRIRQDNFNGNVALGYENILPDDLAPMLILDASGGLRQTYRYWNERGGLETLHSPQKSYSRLRILHLDKGAGKTVQNTPKGVTQVAGWVSEMIQTIPDDEETLIVHYLTKPGYPDIRKAIERKLPRRAGKVHFCSWGRHTATNEFKDCKHVILAGILFYDAAAYEAMGRGAKALSVNDVFSEADFDSVRIGEISHHIFQAAGRGAIRKTVDGGCPEGCNLYAIFSARKGTGFPREELEKIFPDATIEDFETGQEPVKRRLVGNVRRAIEFIEGACPISGPEVRNALVFSKQNFLRLTKREDFQQALTDRGIISEKVGNSVVFKAKR